MSKDEENQSNPSTMINFEGKKLFLKIKVENDNVCIYLTSKDFKNLKGSLSLENAKSQIHAFEDFTIQEVSNAMNGLQSEKHSLKEESGKYALTIKLKVLRKEKPLKIDLEEFQKSKDFIIQELKELKISNISRIFNLRKKQSELEEECQKLKEIKNDLNKKIELKKAQKEKEKEKEKSIPPPPKIISYPENIPIPPPPPPPTKISYESYTPSIPPPPPTVNVPVPSYSYINNYSSSYTSKSTPKFYKGDEMYKDFSIENTKSKTNQIMKLNSSYVNSMCVLADKSLVTCTDHAIHIYDPYTHKFRFSIGSDNNKYNNMVGLSTGKLLVCKKNKMVLIIEIKGKSSKVIQKINMGNCPQAIELTDKGLAIRGHDYKIELFEKKYDDTYIKKDEIYEEKRNMYGIVQIDEKTICVSCSKSGEEDCLLFYDLYTKEVERRVTDVTHCLNGFKLNDEFLIYYEANYIYLIDIETALCVDYYKTSEGKKGGKNPIYACARLTSTTILYGNDNCDFVKLKINDTDLKEVESVRSPHEDKKGKKAVNGICVIGDGHIATAGYDKKILIW